MTRDEAIEIEVKSARSWEPFSKIPDIDIREAAAGTIDCYVALGMLKLDEPKSQAEEKFLEAYRSWPYGWTPMACLDDLKAKGLRIVEK